jgi:hypothetical protein
MIFHIISNISKLLLLEFGHLYYGTNNKILIGFYKIESKHKTNIFQNL